jgi:hypothetical protein
MTHFQFVKKENGYIIYYAPSIGKYIKCDKDEFGNERIVDIKKRLKDLCDG